MMIYEESLSTVAKSLLKRSRPVIVKDSATGIEKSVVRLVNLKSADFADKANFTLYCKTLRKLSPMLSTVSNAMESNDAKAVNTACAPAVKLLTTAINFLSRVEGIEAYNASKADVLYIVKTCVSRVHVKEARTIEVRVKSEAAVRGAFEDTLFFHLNGNPIPKTQDNEKTLVRIAADMEREAKADTVQVIPSTATKGKTTAKGKTTKGKTTAKGKTTKGNVESVAADTAATEAKPA